MPRSRLRATSRQTVDLLRPSREAMADMLRPHTSPSAMNMRSSMLRYLGPVGFGCGMAASVHSAHGASLRPVLRVLPLRHTLPVLLETPTARAASA